MQDKVVLVTGSTSGIGRGIANSFAKKGAKVIIHGFGTKELIQEVLAELKNLGASDIFYHPADLSKPEEIDDLFKQILDKFKKVDILVNNAGTQFVSPVEDFPPEKWESIIRIDLIAAFYTIKNVIPLMKSNKWGRIINIASAHALVASPFKSAYVAAKHGLLGLTKSVALEVGEFSITVNAICPGYVKTPLVLNQVADSAKTRGITQEEVIRDVMLGPQVTKKFVEIEEVADMVQYLCSSSSGSITGSAISIDGGWTSQ